MFKNRHITDGSNHNPNGFTLVELMISVAITGILMIGISYFFTASFNSLFRIQNKASETGRQFIINEIIQEKFSTVKRVVNTSDFKSNPKNSKTLVIENDSGNSRMPFSSIAKNNDEKLVLKDFFIFNKIDKDPETLVFNSGKGRLQKIDGANASPPLTPTTDFINASAFQKINDVYYVVMKNENKVLKCDCGTQSCSCSDINFGNFPLKDPTDITADTNGDNLFISDSGNDRILKYDTSTNNATLLVQDQNYPTGLAYYEKETVKKLFFSNTFDNEVKYVNLNDFQVHSTVGGGTDKTCVNATPSFCKLDRPTGLYTDSTNNTLYISDSGSGRVLTLKDPGKPTDVTFEFTADDHYKLDRVVIENPELSGGEYDEAESTLVGKKENYDPDTKIFSNPGRLTVYSVDQFTEDNKNCKSTVSTFYTNEFPENIGLKNDDFIILNNQDYKITSSTSTECRLTQADPSLIKYQVTVDGNPSPAPGHGDIVYPSNPEAIKIKIGTVDTSVTLGTGYQTFSVKLYDLDKGLVQTEKFTIKVGDEILGTREDELTEKLTGLKFPTGLNDTYVVESGSGDIKVISTGAQNGESISPVNPEKFTDFDYTSDFTLVEPDKLKFTLYNSGKIAEMKMDVQVDDTNTNSFTLNADVTEN